MGNVTVRVDSDGNPIDPNDVLKKVGQGYNQWQNEPVFGSPSPTPAPTPSTVPVNYDNQKIDQANQLGNALMKQKAQDEQVEIQRRADQEKMQQQNALNNYNRIVGNPYTQQAPKPGQVSDEEAALLASEFNKQPTRFTNLKNRIGNK